MTTRQLLVERDSAFIHALYHRNDFLALCQFDPSLDALSGKTLDRLDYDIPQDAHYALTGCPQVADIPLGALWQRVMESPEFASLKALHWRDRAGAAAATAALSEVVFRHLTRVRQPELPEPDDGRRGEENKPDKSEGQGDPGPHNAKPVNAEQGVIEHELSEAERQVEARTILSGGIASFVEGKTPAEQYQAAQGLIAKYDMEAFKRFLGWSARIVHGAAHQGAAAWGEMTGYKGGAWSDKTHPVEMLAVARRDPQAMTRLAENTLQRREYHSSEPRGRGSVILLRDESSSMRLPNATGEPASRHAVALAFELALALAFNQEGRDLNSIAWSSNGTRAYTYGGYGFGAHIQAFLGGGTRVEPAILAGMAMAEEYADASDLLITSDGELHTDPRESAAEYNARMTALVAPFRKAGGRVWAVLVGDEINPTRASATLAWCDGYVILKSLTEDDELGEMLAKVAANTESEKENVD